MIFQVNLLLLLSGSNAYFINGYFRLKVVILDFGMGNLSSINKKIEIINGVNPIISSEPNDLLNCDKIILPGVGNFSRAMLNLTNLNLIKPLNEAVLQNKIPVLGICLGMQLMCKNSQEGDVNGLGWIDANVERFSNQEKKEFKIPHLGWNNCKFKKNSNLFKNINQDDEFYFVHSFYVRLNEINIIHSSTKYFTSFISSFEKENIFGVQFHPEKSHHSGDLLLKNFFNYV